MTQGWEDSHFDVTNPDLGLLMPDCPAELSIQSHGLMLNVRRSVQLSRSREATTASPWTHVSREVKLLRRVKSFQQPAVSTSIVPTLSRIRSFFDFSREDTVALDSEVSSSILPQTGPFCVDKDGHQNAEEEKEEEVGSNEDQTASSDMKPNFEDAAAEAHHLDRDVEEEALWANGNELGKPVTEAMDTAKVDVNESIKKFESAFGEALDVGSVKIDVRERIKRIQTAFKGFIPWDSGTGKPRGEVSDVIAGGTVIGSVKPAVMLTTSQNDAGDEIQQGSSIKDMKGELHDSSIGFGGQACNLGFVCTGKASSVELNQQEQIIRSMEEGGLDNLLNQLDEVQVDIPKDTAIENPAPDGTNDEVEQGKAIGDMEDGGSCNFNEVKEVASGTEVVNPTLSESDAFSQEETLSMENEETELSAVDEVDEVQAVILDFEAIVTVRDTFGELKHVKVNSDTIEERVVECQGVITRDSSCKTSASKSVGIQCDVVCELMQEESPQLSDKLDVTEGSGYTPIASMVDDALGELNQIVKEMDEKCFQDSSEDEKVHAELCWEIATWNSEYLEDDNIVIDKNSPRSAVDDHPFHDEVDKLDVHEQEVICKVLCDKEAKQYLESDNIDNKIPPRSAVDDLLFNDEADKLDVHEQEVICKVMCDKEAKDWNAVDNAQPNALWDSVSALPLDTQIAANSDLTQETFAKEMKANGLRKPSIRVDWVQPEAGGDSKETTDISGLPSPLCQLLDYRNGNAFTVLNVQDHLPDVGECLLHDDEEICYIKPGYLSREIDLRPLSPPCDSWCSQKELISQSNGVENSDTGQSKVTINLRRLRIRKSVCLKALKASSSKMRYRMSNAEIPDRLPALSDPQDLKVEEGALSLIAPRSNRSTDDAETKLDKLSLVDMNISLTSVQKPMGLLPDRELLSLLNFALSADRANTTKMVNEILGSSVEPLLLVSQLGILITNILVENFDVHRETRKSGFCRPNYSRKQTQRRLRQALKILSQAEKYGTVSTDSMTWLTAALLQCESDRPFPSTSIVGSLPDTLMTPKSKEQRLEMLVSTDVGTAENAIHPTEVSKLATEEAHEGHGVRAPQLSEPISDILKPSLEKRTPVVYRKELKEAWALEAKEAEEHKQASNLLNSQEAPVSENFPVLEELDSSKLWRKALQELTSSNLRHLLLTQGRLVSAVMASDGSRVIVEVEFQYTIHKHKAERSWRSICTAFQSVLRIPIELKISLQKNVLFDEGLLPRNLDGMDGEELDLLTQHLSRLNQEPDIVSYSTDSHCGSHSKRRRRRAPKDWQFEELVEPKRKPRHGRSDSWSVPEPIAMQLTPRYKVRERPSARPVGKEWHNNTFESSFSESQEQHSGNLYTMQSGLPAGGKKIKRPRLRTMLDTPLYESDTNQDIRSYSPERMPADFRTERSLPLEAVCFPCTRRETQSRQKPTCHVEDRRQGDPMDRRGRAQGQTFFLRLLPCKSISTVRF